MKIDSNTNNFLVNLKNESIDNSSTNPFDLNLEVTELKLNGNGGRPTAFCSAACSVPCHSLRCIE
jgi:hypothetical protein